LYHPETKIKTLLQLCNFPNVKLYFNGELIKPYKSSKVVLPCNIEVEQLDESYVFCNLAVRINGLYMWEKYIAGYKGYIVDYNITGNPFDDDYPLMSNREEFFKETTEWVKLETIVGSINKVIQDKIDLQKIEEHKLDLYNGYLAMNAKNLNEATATPSFLVKCERVLTQIANLMNFREPFKMGFNGNGGEFACYIEDSMEYYSYHLILVNPDLNLNKFEMLDTLIHEFVHMKGIKAHYDEFVIEYEKIMVKVMEKLATNSIKF